MKRVLVIGWHPEAPYAGGSFNCQIRSFAHHQSNDQVVFYVLDKEGSELRRYASKNIIVEEYTIPSFINRIRNISYPVGRTIEWMYVMPTLRKRASKVVKGRRIDAVYLPIAESSQLTSVAAWLSRRYSIPVYATVHQLGVESKTFAATVRSIWQKPSRLVAKLHATLEVAYIQVLSGGLRRRLASFHGIAAISSSLADKLKATLHRDVTLLRYGFDKEPYMRVSGQEKIYDAVYLGRLVESKGIVDLIEVWKLVVHSMPKAKLLVIGSGTELYTKSIEQKIHDEGLDDNVILAGQKGGDEKIRLLKQSKVFLFLSHFESHADVVTEAIACGLPIVCYDLEAYKSRQKLTNAIYTFGIGDYSDAAKKVLSIIDLDKANVTTVTSNLDSLPTWIDFARSERSFLVE